MGWVKVGGGGWVGMGGRDADRDARALGGKDGGDEGVEPRRVVRV